MGRAINTGENLTCLPIFEVLRAREALKMKVLALKFMLGRLVVVLAGDMNYCELRKEAQRIASAA